MQSLGWSLMHGSGQSYLSQAMRIAATSIASLTEHMCASFFPHCAAVCCTSQSGMRCSVQSTLQRQQIMNIQGKHKCFVCRIEAGLRHALRSALVQDGHAAVQDEAAGLVVNVLDPQPGERILDACAAPGSKTVAAAQRMLQLHRQRPGFSAAAASPGTIVAMDTKDAKVRLVKKNAGLAGVDALVTVIKGRLENLRDGRCAITWLWHINESFLLSRRTDLNLSKCVRDKQSVCLLAQPVV